MKDGLSQVGNRLLRMAVEKFARYECWGDEADAVRSYDVTLRKEWVAQRLLGTYSWERVRIEQLLEEVDSCSGKYAVIDIVQIEITLFVLSQYVFVGFGCKNRLASQQKMEDEAQWKHVPNWIEFFLGVGAL